MEKTKLTALDLCVLVDTILHSLSQGGYWTGSAEKEARNNVLNKLQIILNEMEVEILTSPPNPGTITADSGV